MFMVLGGPVAFAQDINRAMANKLKTELAHTSADTNRVRVLVELGEYQLFKPGEAAADLDTARHYLDEAQHLDETLGSEKWAQRIESVNVMWYMEKGDSLVSRQRYARLLQVCVNAGNWDCAGLTALRMGVWLNNAPHSHADALQQYAMATAFYRAAKNKEGELAVAREIAVVHMYEGRNDLAETELLDVLARYKAIGSPRVQVVYNLLATIYRMKGDFKTGLDYSLKCVETMERTGDTARAPAFYGDLARMYLEVGNRDKSMEYYRLSLAKWRQEALPHFAMYLTAGYIVRDMIAHGKAPEALRLLRGLVADIPPITRIQKACVAQHLAYCYDAMADDAQAEKYYLEAVDLFEKKQLSEISLEAERDLGEFYMRKKQWAKASAALERALTGQPDQTALATMRDLHLMLFTVDSALGNYRAAIHHLHLQKLLNDSIFGGNKTQQIEELQVRYETSKKEQEIRLLMQQAQLTQAELDRQKLMRNVIIVMIALLLLLFIMGFNRYRLKQRNHRLLEQQQQLIRQKNVSLENMISDMDVLLQEKGKLLDEKEWLVREIHHRVKNNMQIVISLLNKQAGYLSNADAVAALRESQQRLQAMSLLHQKLYQEDALSVVSMAVYIQDLVRHIRESFDRHIRFELDIAPVVLEVSNALPLGLILNEAITNALKYAFPGGRDGRIRIVLEEATHGELRLTVEDNGIGLPPGFDLETHSSMGLHLIKMMSEQLNGTFDIHSNGGTVLTICFHNMKTTGGPTTLLTAN